LKNTALGETVYLATDDDNRRIGHIMRFSGWALDELLDSDGEKGRGETAHPNMYSMIRHSHVHLIAPLHNQVFSDDVM
jgi:hypothetical protein